MTQSFSVWAPNAQQVRVRVDGDDHVMRQTGGGWWAAEVGCSPQARYGYLLDEDPKPLPDPRSPRQPDGVHGLSQRFAVDPESWTDARWTGRQLAGGVLYELHIGTFTPEGTFAAAAAKLDHLVALGVTFVEVMPVNAYNGEWGWGYDGVDWYAVHEPYGGPGEFAKFVDACHGKGLAVCLDVVYNHLGPSGNYLNRFGPYLNPDATIWGPRVNLDGADSDEVRRYVIDNALRWFEEFHVDALRLDAVHALSDSTAIPILAELASAAEALSAKVGRPLSLIAESDLNDPKTTTPQASGGDGLAAQWDDDVHHAIHTAVSGERQGYYGDFGSLACLATTLERAFFHAGTYSSFRKRRHGRPIDPQTAPASRFVVYTCNHDQVGNRATGDRPSTYLTPGQLAIKAALVLLSPFTPMLFMGEEWGASTPFQFFSSHPEPEIAKATSQGRRSEFAEHGWSAEEVPDPQDPATFQRSKLDWSEISREPHERLLLCYRDLLALRAAHREFTDPRLTNVRTEHDEQARWFLLHRGRFTVAVNLAAHDVAVPASGEVVLAWGEPAIDGERATLPPHSFAVFLRPSSTT
ncbi:malto-oligosyltrehalose trehalohydrolase [Segniliparus rugosus]|uniref:Malto-oligosyltrehalose trehalohydrolase n=1 Tax=Segniliparus rugosus (strain ATCC BAA-974 / DSM 45345 / CCUG 50838 / CIP 108380 / JCM 13579 / CDC 945) TaxID=679197 RepID=E5XNA7_SEGRC|nr:malto-oligosyltrehalose trehalohydrolase [Segniliparus rugosus]EFV14167.1 malto-oligosyltrehalose trehalohydrolase [Segniliparus rugosus ATCC BAA-974]